MSGQRILGGSARAAIAVVALYALVLQAFLTGFIPVGGPQAHGYAELCAPSSDGSDTPAKQTHKTCCTLACSALVVPMPAPGLPATAWPVRDAEAVTFTAASPPPARGPPVHAHSPRGPPAA